MALLAAVVYGLGLGAHNARAGTPTDWQATQTVAVPAPTAVLYPTNVAPAAAQPAAAAEAKSPQMVVDDQTAGAQTSVTQQQPTNVVVSVRIGSPGDNGPISQSNVAVGVANGTNDAATGQRGTSGGAGQDASTSQQAGAGTTVTQDGAGNLVVTVRINSPGNNGPVSQTNAAVGSSSAQNSSATNQGGQSQAPAQHTAPAPKKAAGGAPRHVSGARTPRHEQAAAKAAPAPASPVAQAPAWHSAGATAASAVRAHPRHSVRARSTHRARTPALGRSSADRLSAGPLGKAVSDAGNFLGSMAPTAPIGAQQGRADVSSSVLYSLLVVLGVSVFFVAWSLRPVWRRQRRFGSWLLR